LLFFDGNKDKLVSTALKDLKTAFAQSVVEQSIHLNTTTVASNGLSLFKALPFKWMDRSGAYHLIQSSNDLAKAIDISIDSPSPTHSMYSKELVIYVATSSLYCGRDDIPDCSNLSKILSKVPKRLTAAELLALSSTNSSIDTASIAKTAGEVRVKPVFFECVAEVRDSPKFFKILRIKFTSSQQWECIESNLHGYRFVQYKLIRPNIDICTVNRDKKCWLNLFIWGKCYGAIYGWQADFRNGTRGA
jgi:hypothetical protein